MNTVKERKPLKALFEFPTKKSLVLSDEEFQAMQAEAERLAAEPARVMFAFVEMQVTVSETESHLVITDGNPVCTCGHFRMWGTCAHALGAELSLTKFGQFLDECNSNGRR